MNIIPKEDLLNIMITNNTWPEAVNKYTSIIDEYCANDVLATEEALYRLYGRGLPEIRKVIFHDPATIIIWADGSKSIVKCTEKDKYDPEKGFAMAIAKKALGNKGNYYNIFKEYIPVSEDETDLYYLDNIEL